LWALSGLGNIFSVQSIGINENNTVSFFLARKL